MMRLPASEYTARPWRIHALAGDFQLEDLWALPVIGDRGDFARLIAQLAAGDPAQGPSPVVRLLWAARWKLGALFGWDSPAAGPGARVRSLRDRLPPDLQAAPGPDFAALPFRSLYLLEDEFAAETANRTVHAVMHVGWVPDGTGGYRGQLAVLVRPNGLLGAAYLAGIRPFRHLIVYPQLMRDMARRWRPGAVPPSPPAAGRCAGLPAVRR